MRTSTVKPDSPALSTAAAIFVLVCCHEDRHHLQVLARLSMIFFHTGLARELIDMDENETALERLLSTERDLLGRKRG